MSSSKRRLLFVPSAPLCGQSCKPFSPRITRIARIVPCSPNIRDLRDIRGKKSDSAFRVFRVFRGHSSVVRNAVSFL